LSKPFQKEQKDIATSEVPQFYHPYGKPIDTITEQANKASLISVIG